ncbi:MAG: hypothetical protein P4M05_28190 [Bradyrhizobium sp.]|nr:hypothetical protein [Bradyrhizobium sp.]
MLKNAALRIALAVGAILGFGVVWIDPAPRGMPTIVDKAILRLLFAVGMLAGFGEIKAPESRL